MAHQNTTKQSQSSRGLVVGVVVFYLVAALAMVMANKWVLNTTSAPLFFLLVQLIIAVLLFLISDLIRILPDRLTFDLGVCKGLVPMVGLNIIGLSFSNYTLKYVDASFYQVARGLVLPFTVLTSYTLLHTRPSLLILTSCSIVTLGFFIGVFLDNPNPNPNLSTNNTNASTGVSLVGIAFGVASSSITALHSVIIKKALPVVGGSTLLLSWYTNLLSAIVLAPIIIIAGEGPDVLRLLAGLDTVVEEGMSPLRTFMWGSLITGALGFLMSIASLLSIKVTSPITHMVSSAVRGVAASLLGMKLFGDVITTGRASSITTILLGSFYYTWVKHQESTPSPISPTNTNTTSSTFTSGLGSRKGSRSGEYEKVALEDIEAGLRKTSPRAYVGPETKPE